MWLTWSSRGEMAAALMGRSVLYVFNSSNVRVSHNCMPNAMSKELNQRPKHPSCYQQVEILVVSPRQPAQGLTECETNTTKPRTLSPSSNHSPLYSLPPLQPPPTSLSPPLPEPLSRPYLASYLGSFVCGPCDEMGPVC